MTSEPETIDEKSKKGHEPKKKSLCETLQQRKTRRNVQKGRREKTVTKLTVEAREKPSSEIKKVGTA